MIKPGMEGREITPPPVPPPRPSGAPPMITPAEAEALRESKMRKPVSRVSPAPPSFTLEEAYVPGETGRAATEHAVELAREIGYEEKDGRIVSSWKAVRDQLVSEGWSPTQARALAVSALGYLTKVGERRREKPGDKFVDILGEKYLLQQEQFARKYGEAFGAKYKPHEAPRVMGELTDTQEALYNEYLELNAERAKMIGAPPGIILGAQAYPDLVGRLSGEELKKYREMEARENLLLSRRGKGRGLCQLRGNQGDKPLPHHDKGRGDSIRYS